MLTAVQGVYRDGRVVLDEDPGVIGDATVVVTFLRPSPMAGPPTDAQMVTFGVLCRIGRRQSDLDDFKVAEHVDDDLDGGGDW